MTDKDEKNQNEPFIFDSRRHETYVNEEDGLVYNKNTQNSFTGAIGEFHENGQLKTERNYKDGKKHGLQEDFHKNCQLKCRGNYKNGKKEGLVEIFYAKGQLKLRENFKNGKHDGLSEQFDRNGNLRTRNYKNGKLHGLYEYYYKNGQLMERGSYKNGKTDGISEKFYDDGQPAEEEEKRMFEVFDYIKNNVKDILIADIEVISHIKPSKSFLKTEKGFIHFLWKYPVFPKRNKEEIQFSKEALHWYMEFYDLCLMDRINMGVLTSTLGGIRIEDVKKWRYRKLIGNAHSLWESSDYFENVYSFFEESSYCFDGWREDSACDFTDEGIDFKWSYPPYFSIFDEGLKHFSQKSWEYFLDEGLGYFGY